MAVACFLMNFSLGATLMDKSKVLEEDGTLEPEFLSHDNWEKFDKLPVMLLSEKQLTELLKHISNRTIEIKKERDLVRNTKFVEIG